MAMFRTAALCLMVTAPTTALAAEPVVQAVQTGTETARFQQGVVTLDLERERGAVQVTPLPMDHGSLSFAVAVFNKADAPANIDISNFSVVAGTQALPVFSKDQLESKAKNRAMWAQIAVAAVGGLGAAAAASQRDTYRSTLVTPHGTYRYHASAPSAAGQVAAATSVAGAGVGIAAIQNRLDETRAALGNNIVQLTTVDVGESYAGQIVVAKIKNGALPQRVVVTVRWNGEDYPFTFQLAKKGTPVPTFTALKSAAPAPAPAVVPAALAPAPAPASAGVATPAVH